MYIGVYTCIYLHIDSLPLYQTSKLRSWRCTKPRKIQTTGPSHLSLPSRTLPLRMYTLLFSTSMTTNIIVTTSIMNFFVFRFFVFCWRLLIYSYSYYCLLLFLFLRLVLLLLLLLLPRRSVNVQQMRTWPTCLEVACVARTTYSKCFEGRKYCAYHALRFSLRETGQRGRSMCIRFPHHSSRAQTIS